MPTDKTRYPEIWNEIARAEAVDEIPGIKEVANQVGEF